MSVWRAFKSACEGSGKQAACYTKVIKLWEQFHPEIMVAKPMTDLCLTCQQNTSKLLRSENLLDREKSQCVLAQQEHLNCVQTERDFYRNACTESKNNFERLADSIKLDEQHGACSLVTTIHYSFDFAQLLFQVIRCSQARYTSKRHANAESSASCVRLFLNKLTT